MSGFHGGHGSADSGFHGGSDSSNGGFHGGLSSSDSSSESSSTTTSSRDSSISSNYSSSSGGYTFTSFDYDEDKEEIVTSGGDGEGFVIFIISCVLVLSIVWAIFGKGFQRFIAIALIALSASLLAMALKDKYPSATELNEKLKGLTDLNKDGKIDEADLVIKESMELKDLDEERKRKEQERWDELRKSQEEVEERLSKYVVVEAETPKNKLKTRILRIIGYIFIALGVLFFFLLEEYQYKATITSTSWVTDAQGEVYEVYSFSYTINGKEYIGRGDDDAAYTLDNERYFDIALGEEYTIYASIISPEKYQFEPTNTNVAIAILLSGVGIAFFLIGFISRRKFLVSIQHIGDLNNDGKINEKDLIIFNHQEYEKRMEEFNKSSKNNRRCAFCGSKISKDELFCSFCGAAKKLNND